jgi:hypothetical protein
MGSLTIGLALDNPTGKFQSNNFIVTNMSTVLQKSYSGDKFLILGIVKNIGNKTFDEVSVVANLYDKNGSLIDVVQTTPIYHVGFPNSTSPYKFEVYVNASHFDNYLIQLGGKEGSSGTNIFNNVNSNRSENVNDIQEGTLQDCYGNNISWVLLGSILSAKEINLLDPAVKSYFIDMCEFYKSQLGFYPKISTLNDNDIVRSRIPNETLNSFHETHPMPGALEQLRELAK